MILVLILSLIVGTGVIIYAFQFYKKNKNPFIKSLFLYLIFFNLFIVVGLSYQYLLVNVFDNNFSKIPFKALAIPFFLVFGAEFGITYTLFRLISDLKEKSYPKLINILLIIWVSVFGSATIIGTIVFLQESTYELLYIIHEIWILSMVTIIPILFIDLIIYTYQNHIWLKTKRKSVRVLGIVFLVLFLYFAFSNLDFYFFDFNIDEFDPIHFLVLNLWPFFWLKFYYEKYNSGNFSIRTRQGLFNELLLRNKISEREKEIIELIISGKSNKEIEQELFISFNTVKNHIYNIYKKVGVSSRSQLIHFFQEKE